MAKRIKKNLTDAQKFKNITKFLGFSEEEAFALNLKLKINRMIRESKQSKGETI